MCIIHKVQKLVVSGRRVRERHRCSSGNALLSLMAEDGVEVGRSARRNAHEVINMELCDTTLTESVPIAETDCGHGVCCLTFV